VFLALRGDEGDVEYFWPILLEMPVDKHPEGPRQLCLLLDDRDK
jgi:hypothetical protein